MIDATEILRWLYAHFDYPLALILIIPAIIILFWILRKEFVAVKDELEVKIQKRKVRKLLKYSRTLILLLLVIALSSPYIQEEKIIEGDPFIQLLVDNSTSMELFEDISAQLAQKLEKKTTVDVKYIGSETVSNIGDSVLNNLQPHSSVLLLSDGHATAGADLGDVALFAAKLNSTVNAIKLNSKQQDVAVMITGPSKALENSENTYTVFLSRAGTEKSVHLKVTLDGEVIYDQITSEGGYQFTRMLGTGTHKITAELLDTDHFSQNNVYYKTVRVVPRPKLLLLSEKSTPLEPLLKQVYVVDIATRLPSDLSSYYAIAVNDLPASSLDSAADVLNDFIADGNGMIVFGGENSYDLGGYKNSMFETLLPFIVASPEKKEGDTLVAIVIDISGSQGTPFGRFESTSDFSKAATLGIINNVAHDTKVAVIAFNSQAYLISEPTPAFSKNTQDIISRLKWGGGTRIGAGIMKAISVISPFTGSKNIVLLSDGKTQGAAEAQEAARFASNNGIKIYTVGVGPTTDEETMMAIAELTNGIYFRATDETRLNLIFGDTDDKEAQSGRMEFVVLNKNHFITENLEPNATLYGYNQVAPKGAARLLATTSTGEPALAVWRLGLGRVAAFGVDDGSKWASSMLTSGNSKIITRSINWVIGDPERKSLSFIDAKDTRIGEPSEVTVRTKTIPDAKGVVFYKTDEDTYSGTVLPTATGYQEIAGAVFAVNYPLEYQYLGLSDELEGVVSSTGGKMFGANDIDEIVQHAKSRAKRAVNDKNYLRWPFVLLAVLLFLAEIFIRRLIRRD